MRGEGWISCGIPLLFAPPSIGFAARAERRALPTAGNKFILLYALNPAKEIERSVALILNCTFAVVFKVGYGVGSR
jgi:hypothetical protein